MTLSEPTPPATLTALLIADERILWWGAPQQKFMLMPRDGVLIPFSLVWGGFSIFWEWNVLASKAPASFALFGLPFVAVGLFLIGGRFLVDAWLRARTTYALTDRRVLIVRTGAWPSVRALFLDRLPETTLLAGRGGRGSIRFGTASPVFERHGGRGSFGAWVASLDPAPHFLGIDEAPRVYASIQQHAQAGAPGGRTASV